MQKVHIYVESDTTAPRQMPRMIGRIMICESFPDPKDWRHRYIGNFGTYHAVILRGMAEAIDQLTRPCEIYVHSQNNWILNQIDQNLPVWGKNGFRSKTGKEIKNIFEWRWLWKSLETYNHTIVTVQGPHEHQQEILEMMERVKVRGN